MFVQPHFCRSAGSEVLDKNVGCTQKCVENVQPCGLFKVKCEALFRSVCPNEMGRQAACPRVVVTRKISAIGALDLDDTGAEFGKLARREWRGYRMFECDDGNAG